ncbi:hypothetical protein EGW08_011179 [Elysia chlorotica]|uniref:Uncharacterized protein n=1 Tax=Elysia chlorotica TaxID=188477 RepID=A0A3S0ZKL1_ELYCH|nr:hypothetical protein EGW08_011179 [Elysia chlorotica]
MAIFLINVLYNYVLKFYCLYILLNVFSISKTFKTFQRNAMINVVLVSLLLLFFVLMHIAISYAKMSNQINIIIYILMFYTLELFFSPIHLRNTYISRTKMALD